MLMLAHDRASGARRYLCTPEHTAAARAVLGSDALLASEQAVLLERDPIRARETARDYLRPYLGLPFYTDNLARHGMTEADISGGGSNRLVNALVAWGDEAAVVERVAEHRAAGADHVAVRVLTMWRSVCLEPAPTICRVSIGVVLPTPYFEA